VRIRFGCGLDSTIYGITFQENVTITVFVFGVPLLAGVLIVCRCITLKNRNWVHGEIWEDDVLEDIKSLNIGNWKKVAQNRDSWKKVVEQARNLHRL
jgi:hypothetical protein